MPAGVGNAVDLDANDGAGSGIGREVRSQLGKFCICLGNHLALAVEPDNSRVAVEGTEHSHDPAIFFEVGDRFYAAAS